MSEEDKLTGLTSLCICLFKELLEKGCLDPATIAALQRPAEQTLLDCAKNINPKAAGHLAALARQLGVSPMHGATPE
jgi:hypothetical protein